MTYLTDKKIIKYDTSNKFLFPELGLPDTSNIIEFPIRIDQCPTCPAEDREVKFLSDEVNLTNLKPGTTYYFKAINSYRSVTGSFTTPNMIENNVKSIISPKETPQVSQQTPNYMMYLILLIIGIIIGAYLNNKIEIKRRKK